MKRHHLNKKKKMIEFFQKNPDAKYFKWNPEKEKYEDTAVTKDASGLMGTRKLEEKKKF